jgi:hypothetical protein
VTTRTEAPSHSATFAMNDKALGFGMRRPWSSASDHGFGRVKYAYVFLLESKKGRDAVSLLTTFAFFRVKATGSLGVVRTRDTRPFLPDGLHGRSHPVRDENFVFPPKASSPARSSVSAPFHNFRNPHLLGFFSSSIFCFVLSYGRRRGKGVQ